MAASRRRRLLAGGAAIGLLVLTGVVTRAQNELDVSFHSFQDSRGVTVISPEGSYAKEVSDRTSLKATFGVDAISAASDSCARCHPSGASNGRFVGGLSATRKYGDSKVTLGAQFSRELFYTATTGLLAVSHDMNKSNTSVAGGLSFSLNQPVLHPGKDAESQISTDGFASVSQSWTRGTVTQFGYELNQVNGYQTSPFLRTSVNGILTLGNSPDTRTRQALTARLRQALPASTFLEADYRYYHDSWSVDSGALSVGASHHFGQTLVGGLSYRRYTQTGAYFYQPAYTGSPTYYTGDFRLFPFDSNNYTGRLEITPKHGIFTMPPGTVLTLMYERYLATTGFQAGIFTAGVRIPLK